MKSLYLLTQEPRISGCDWFIQLSDNSTVLSDTVRKIISLSD